jgi:hypothetical protein
MRFHTAHVTKEFPQVRANDFWAHGIFFTNHEPMFNQDLHYLQTEWIELPLEPRHLGVPLVASKMISESMVRLAQIVHLSCTDTNTISKWTETRFHIPHITNEFHRLRSNWFSHPMVHLAQTVHLSCVKISTISKWTESSFHLGLIT